MIKPTVGRVVLFHPADRSDGDQPFAALVARVWSDTCINVGVFDANGKPMANPPTSVRLLQDDEEPPAGQCYCCWMPYQKGQAAKYEELEKKLAQK